MYKNIVNKIFLLVLSKVYGRVHSAGFRGYRSTKHKYFSAIVQSRVLLFILAILPFLFILSFHPYPSILLILILPFLSFLFFHSSHSYPSIHLILILPLISFLSFHSSHYCPSILPFLFFHSSHYYPSHFNPSIRFIHILPFLSFLSFHSFLLLSNLVNSQKQYESIRTFTILAVNPGQYETKKNDKRNVNVVIQYAIVLPSERENISSVFGAHCIYIDTFFFVQNIILIYSS